MVDPARVEVQRLSLYDCLVMLDMMRSRTMQHDEMMPQIPKAEAEIIAGIEYGVLSEVIERLKGLDPVAAEAFDQYRLHQFDEAYQGRILSIEYTLRSDDA